MSSLIVRSATRADLPAVLALYMGGEAVKGQHGELDADNPDLLRTFDMIVADPNHQLVVGEIEGDVVATMQITYLPYLTGKTRLRAQFEGVHVRADQRGKGLGKELIDWALDQCRARGAGMVQLTSNKLRKDAHRFYETLGFERSHEGFKLTL